jgi:DNA repair protein RecO (recombination protein O)
VTTARGDAGVRHADRALLLRRFPYGESSLILHALTPGAGRVAWLAKGAYRASSAYFAVFDLFDTLDVRWSKRRGQELGLVTRASLCTRRQGMVADLARFRAALALIELAQLTGREEQEEHELFLWLERHLDLLAGGRADPGLVLTCARLSLLRANGLAPALDDCASCGTALRARQESAAFSNALGGRLCRPCATLESGRGRALEHPPIGVLRVTGSLARLTPDRLEHTRLDARLELRVGSLVERFLEYHLETRPRTSSSPPPLPSP